MPRAMFRDALEPPTRIGSRARYTVLLSVLAHTVIGAALVAVPLMATDALPAPQAMLAFAMPAAPPPPPPPPPQVPAAVRRQAPEPASHPDAAPLSAPDEIRPEGPSAFVPPISGVPGGVEGGLPSGPLGGVMVEAPVAPPLRATAPEPLRVGGAIKAPRKVRHVSPVYPAIAQSAHVEGIVIIDATIGADGRVQDAHVRRGHPLLDQAALDAVRQWTFTPTLLNGVPVPVIMTVTVRFTLR
jgi:periplasmic protein TonB